MSILVIKKKLQSPRMIYNYEFFFININWFYNKCWGVKTPVYFFKKKMHL